MRPNLSLTNIAATLAALGSAAVLSTACGGGEKPATDPAKANEVTTAPAGSGHASCAANGSCGAKAGGGDTKPADTTATPASTAASTDTKTADPKADAKPADPKTGAQPAATTTAAPKTTGTTAAKPPPAGSGGAKPKGMASCGAGTCASDPKKK